MLCHISDHTIRSYPIRSDILLYDTLGHVPVELYKPFPTLNLFPSLSSRHMTEGHGRFLNGGRCQGCVASPDRDIVRNKTATVISPQMTSRDFLPKAYISLDEGGNPKRK